MNLFDYNPAVVLSFILTLMRVSIIMFMLPIFSTQNIPTLIKAAVSLVFTLGVWPAVALSGAFMPAHPFDIAIMLLGEVVVGLVLGMVIDFLFMGIQAGGELLGFQMGFAMISFADPISGNRTGPAAFFIWMVSLLTFLSLEGHLYMIRGFAGTFELIPPGGLFIGQALLDQVVSLSAGVFRLALKICAPVMAALFMVEVALGLVARTSPQIRIMEFGFPIKIGVGFFFIGLIFSIMAQHIGSFISGMDGLFTNILRAMSPLYN